MHCAQCGPLLALFLSRLYIVMFSLCFFHFFYFLKIFFIFYFLKLDSRQRPKLGDGQFLPGRN